MTILHELIWIRDIQTEMSFVRKALMRLYYDNLLAIYTVQNSDFHERTKYIEVDGHVVREKYDAVMIEPKHLCFSNQLADLLTKSLGRSLCSSICEKLGMYDIYTPT